MADSTMHRHHQSDAGAIYIPERPLFAQADDDLLRGLETLLFFSWDPEAPGPWFARLAAFPLAGGAYFIAWERDGQPPQLVARLVPARLAAAGRALWPLFVRDFLANPATYQSSALDPAILPETITNYRPDLVSRGALHAALEVLGAPADYFEGAYVEEG